MAYDFYKAPEDDKEFDVYVMAYQLEKDRYPMLKVSTSTGENREVMTMMTDDYLRKLEFASAKDKQRVYRVFGGRQQFHERMQGVIRNATVTNNNQVF